MADSRDKPELELETLSYRDKEHSAKPSSAPMGFNSVVIKPETRVNKTENAEKTLEQPHPNNYVNMSKHLTIEQLNKNLMIIEEIEGLMSKVNDKLIELPDIPKVMRCQLSIKSLALEEIDLFKKTTLSELRKAFE